jgi:hypothetical protein
VVPIIVSINTVVSDGIYNIIYPYVVSAVTWLRWEGRKVCEIRAEVCHAKWRDLMDVTLLYVYVYSDTTLDFT